MGARGGGLGPRPSSPSSTDDIDLVGGRPRHLGSVLANGEDIRGRSLRIRRSSFVNGRGKQIVKKTYLIATSFPCWLDRTRFLVHILHTYVGPEFERQLTPPVVSPTSFAVPIVLEGPRRRL